MYKNLGIKQEIIELSEKVEQELQEQYKKIDIIIEADNTVYAIENKIGAQLYNDLSVYSKHLEKKYAKNNPNKIKIVLTAHSLSPDDKQKASKCGFEEIS